MSLSESDKKELKIQVASGLIVGAIFLVSAYVVHKANNRGNGRP